MKELLNIVDEQDNIIGIKTREEIHKKGLLHREVHVYFVTPDKKIIFQHRAKDKDTFPDLLDATVGGHVEIGNSYDETAIKETVEETGVTIDSSELIFVNKIKKYSGDKVTGKINNVFNSRYIFRYKGDIKDLKVEAGKALGFEAWPIESLKGITESDKAKFIPYIISFAVKDLLEFINQKGI